MTLRLFQPPPPLFFLFFRLSAVTCVINFTPIISSFLLCQGQYMTCVRLFIPFLATQNTHTHTRTHIHTRRFCLSLLPLSLSSFFHPCSVQHMFVFNQTAFLSAIEHIFSQCNGARQKKVLLLSLQLRRRMFKKLIMYDTYTYRVESSF